MLFTPNKTGQPALDDLVIHNYNKCDLNSNSLTYATRLSGTFKIKYLLIILERKLLI